jgi:hypothetical protein
MNKSSFVSSAFPPNPVQFSTTSSKDRHYNREIAQIFDQDKINYDNDISRQLKIETIRQEAHKRHQNLKLNLRRS